VQHLDLRHAGGRRGASARPMQQHAAAFRPSQAIVAVAIGTHVVGTYSRPSYLPLPLSGMRQQWLGRLETKELKKRPLAAPTRWTVEWACAPGGLTRECPVENG
jgi:hypothetical protein